MKSLDFSGDDIGEKDDIEFVVGVGAAKDFKKREETVTEKQKEILRARGYTGITVNDVFDDILREKTNYQADEILKSTYPLYKKLSNANIPAFRYLREAGITDRYGLRQVRTLLLDCSPTAHLVAVSTLMGIVRSSIEISGGLCTQKIIDRTTPGKSYADAAVPAEKRD